MKYSELYNTAFSLFAAFVRVGRAAVMAPVGRVITAKAEEKLKKALFKHTDLLMDIISEDNFAADEREALADINAKYYRYTSLYNRLCWSSRYNVSATVNDVIKEIDSGYAHRECCSAINIEISERALKERAIELHTLLG